MISGDKNSKQLEAEQREANLAASDLRRTKLTQFDAYISK